MWQAPLALFPFFCEIFSNLELFSDRELHDARTPLALFLLYCELFSDCDLFSDREFLPTVNCVTHTLRLRPVWRTHYVWQAPLALFLLYHELFSDRELFTDRELCDARILAPPHVTHALHLLSSACTFSIVL